MQSTTAYNEAAKTLFKAFRAFSLMQQGLILNIAMRKFMEKDLAGVEQEIEHEVGDSTTSSPDAIVKPLNTQTKMRADSSPQNRQSFASPKEDPTPKFKEIKPEPISPTSKVRSPHSPANESPTSGQRKSPNTLPKRGSPKTALILPPPASEPRPSNYVPSQFGRNEQDLPPSRPPPKHKKRAAQVSLKKPLPSTFDGVLVPSKAKPPEHVDTSVGSIRFVHRVDTEVNIFHPTNERYRRMSVADVSFDTDSTPEDTSKEDITAKEGESRAMEIVEDPAEEMKKTPEIRPKNEELVFMQAPYKELPPPQLEEKKVPESQTKFFKFLVGAISIPRGGTSGEDAYLATPRALGVADGVSGWYQYGIDSAAFSSQLMQQCEEHITDMLNASPLTKSDSISVDPMVILSAAYEKVTAVGSSTATLVLINGDTLHGLNLGDSGFVCFTKMGGKYVSRGVSKEQQHNFNTPFQLSKFPSEEDIEDLKRRVPPQDIKQLLQTMERGDLCQDPPSAADGYKMQLHEDDIVVLGTDGLFDNLFKDEIKKIVREVVKGVSNFDDKIAKELAGRLACKTYERSKSNNIKTPFQVKYKRELNSSWTKGKEDDITVVIGIVKPIS